MPSIDLTIGFDPVPTNRMVFLKAEKIVQMVKVPGRDDLPEQKIEGKIYRVFAMAPMIKPREVGFEVDDVVMLRLTPSEHPCLPGYLVVDDTAVCVNLKRKDVSDADGFRGGTESVGEIKPTPES